MPFSRANQSKKNEGNRGKRGYIEDGVRGDWFLGQVSEPVRLQNRVKNKRGTGDTRVPRKNEKRRRKRKTL